MARTVHIPQLDNWLANRVLGKNEIWTQGRIKVVGTDGDGVYIGKDAMEKLEKRMKLDCPRPQRTII